MFSIPDFGREMARSLSDTARRLWRLSSLRQAIRLTLLFLIILLIAGVTALYRIDVELRPLTSFGRGVAREAQGEIFEVVASTFLWAGLAVASITLSAGLWLGLLAQRRLSRVSTCLARIASGDLATRIQPVTDKDDLDQVAAQIDKSTESLEQSVRQMRELARNIAHDLRTPVARLRAGLEEALLAAEPSIEQQSAAIETAIEQTDRIGETFNAIMRISRIEGGAGREGFTDLDLERLCREIGEIFAPVIEESGRLFTLDLHRTRPLRGDRELIIQLVANLMQNALRHTPKGTEIRLSAADLSLELADDGPGIPVPERSRVLEPLYRLDRARHSEGAGLGLSLVRAITKLHDAELKLLDNERAETGLAVRVTFPPARLA